MFSGDKMMFPKTTIIGKKIPKQRFYDNIDLKSSVQKKFVKQVECVLFSNKFSKETLNIPKTDDVEEIFVFDIILKDKKYLEKIEDVLAVIDKSVPYPILYRFKSGASVTYKIACKKRNQNDHNKSVVDVYLTRNVPFDEQELFGKEFDKIFNALNMKILYDNILRLFLRNKTADVAESVEDEKKHLYLKNEIGRLNKLMVKEKQADKQYGLHSKIKKLKVQIEDEN